MAFKTIQDNIETFGFWTWLSREFNTYYYDSGGWYWGNPGFLKSCFNYFIGHPFLGWGVSSIAILLFDVPRIIGIFIVIAFVILVEMYQFIWQKEAEKWFPVDAFFDVLTWTAGAVIFYYTY